MSSEIAIKVEGLSKCYQIYDQPRDRLKQFVLPRLLNTVGLPPQQYFREFWALRDVSFEVGKGEVLGIIGRNGSGKSTLLQLICGTLNPSSGRVQVNGRVAALLELGSGFNPEFTGRENVYLNAAVLGLSKREIELRFDSIVAFAEIGAFVDQPVKTYSSGMVLRLAFAVASNVDPDILVVDEALAVGDELFQRKCFARIEAIRNAGATILFVSHSGGQVIELCDRALLIDGGEKVVIGEPKAIVGGYQKLLYAPEASRSAIRDNLGADDSGDREGEQPNRGGHILHQQDGLAVQADLECFDPELKPSSTIAYESRGAVIDEPHIKTLSGERVNNLVSGRQYRYTYTVHFSEQARNVRFGMNIKTISGVELGGAVSARYPSQGVPLISVGSDYWVDFVFTACFNQGMYFMNAGVTGSVGDGEEFLHRLVDAVGFRVIQQADGIAAGIVNISPSLQSSHKVSARSFYYAGSRNES